MDKSRDEAFIEEALRIVKLGEEQGIPFRLLGAIAIRLHCPRFNYLYAGMDRPLTDIDYVTYGKFSPQIKKFFVSLGYTPNERIIAYYGKHRHIYWNEEKQWQVDIFFDELNMCHKVDFRGRLELDSPTITLTDLLLEKMQIVKINPKDIKDTIIMLREHQIGDTEEETINAPYIARILADDWGFWYTVTTNLNRVKRYLGEFGALTEEDRKDVAGKIDALLEVIDRTPKTTKWKLRAKIGPRLKWYNEVEEVVR